jgi:hypothetical protein
VADKWHLEVSIFSCEGIVCRTVFDVDPHNGPLADQARGLVVKLEEKYAPSTNISEASSCGDDPIACIDAGHGDVLFAWQVDSEVTQVVALAQEADRVHLRVGYHNETYLSEFPDELDPGDNDRAGICDALDGLFPCKPDQ